MGITDGLMKSDTHPDWSTQEAVDHLSLHDSRNVAMKASMAESNSANAVYMVSQCYDSSTSSSDYDYGLREDYQKRFRGGLSSRYPLGRYNFNCRGTGRGESSGPNSQAETESESDSSGHSEVRGARAGRAGRSTSNFIGQPGRFLSYGSFDSILSGLRQIAIDERDGKGENAIAYEKVQVGAVERPKAPAVPAAPAAPAAPASDANPQRGGWCLCAGTKPFEAKGSNQNRNTSDQINLCRGCGLYTSTPLKGKCVYGQLHFCDDCGSDSHGVRLHSVH